MSGVLELVGRREPLFQEDVRNHASVLSEMIREGRFLVIGGAGSIGQAVVREIFARSPHKLHVVDLSENNLVELVRDIRSSLGYIDGDFATFAVDCGSDIFEELFEAEGPYDYVLNLSAMKHVRSEGDRYTLLRLVETNVLNTEKTLGLAVNSGVRRYFSVSTDKAANPVNLMGASKRIMEFVLRSSASRIIVSTARFANVAFSDGSLLHGFTRRLEKGQPLSAPSDVQRYFITQREAGQLCLLAAMLAQSGEIVYPKLDNDLDLISFDMIAVRFLRARGYEPFICDTEEEARERAGTLEDEGRWPCYFFKTDTTGEKPFEEFVAVGERVDTERFSSLGAITDTPTPRLSELKSFLSDIRELRQSGVWEKGDVVSLVDRLVPNFGHMETGKNLDDRM